jgi:hypothetical protein
MTTQFTPILQLALPVTGELNGTWGDVVNDNITSMVEEAIAGAATINTWAGSPPAHTLTTANGTTDEARCAMLICSGAPGAAAEVICPAKTKLYVVSNNVTGGFAVTIKTAAGTGVSVPNGYSMLVYCDGTNVNNAVNYVLTPGAIGTTVLAYDSNLQTFVTTFTLPTVDGTNGQAITTNGSGTLGFSSIPSLASPLAVVGNNTSGASIRLPEDTDNGSNYVALKAPDALAANLTLTLPAADGTNGQVVTTDGAGNLTFTTPSGGITTGKSIAMAMIFGF